MGRATVHGTVGNAAEMVGRPLLAAMLAVALVASPGRALAGPADPTHVPAAVLVLDGDNTESAHTATQRLRTALADRGFSSEHTSTTAELTLALDCGKFDAGCAAKAAPELGVDRIFYGTLRSSPPGLTLRMFDAKQGVVAGEVHVPMASLDVEAQEAAVVEAVDALLPHDDNALPPPTAASVVAPPDAPGAVGSDTRQGKYIWGAYDPRPTWKKAFLGTSIAVGATGLILGVALGVPAFQAQRQRGRLYDDLVTEAEASLQDGNPVNDVNPATVEDLCSDQPGSGGALEDITPEGGDTVSGIRNADVARVCQRGSLYATIGTVGWVMFAAGTLGSIAATTLYFVRKNPNATAWRRRGLHIGAAPTRRGAALSAGFRF